MNSVRKVGLALTSLLLAGTCAISVFAAKAETFTGEVSDAMCGAKHGVSDKAACTRACVRKGSNYVLIVGDMVYTLKADEASKTKLDKLAGEQAKVTGTAEGDTIKVMKVMVAK